MSPHINKLKTILGWSTPTNREIIKMLTIVATSNFPTATMPEMKAIFGSGVGYAPSPLQVALQGSAVYQTPVNSAGVSVSSGIVQYEFFIGNSVSSPFAFGEFLLTDPSGLIIYAVGALSSLQYRVIGQSVTLSIYFNITTGPVTVFGETSTSATTPLLAYIGSANNLTPVAQNAAVANCFLIQSPVNIADSMLCYASYQVPGVLYDFDSWSFENYVLIGEALTTGIVLGNKVVLPLSTPTQTYAGQYIIQTASYVRVVSGLLLSSLETHVPLDVIALALTPTGTAFKLFAYTGNISTSEALVGALTVTAAQINAIASLIASKVILSDGSVNMLAPLNMGAHKVINVTEPVNPTDVVTKAALDSAAGISILTLEALGTAVSGLSAQVQAIQSFADSQVILNAELSTRITALGG